MGNYGRMNDPSGLPSVALQKKYDPDANNNVVYEGWAAPGAATSEAAWAIIKRTYDGNNLVAEQWAEGTAECDKVWDNRATTIQYS